MKPSNSTQTESLSLPDGYYPRSSQSTAIPQGTTEELCLQCSTLYGSGEEHCARCQRTLVQVRRLTISRDIQTYTTIRHSSADPPADTDALHVNQTSIVTNPLQPLIHTQALSNQQHASRAGPPILFFEFPALPPNSSSSSPSSSSGFPFLPLPSPNRPRIEAADDDEVSSGVDSPISQGEHTFSSPPSPLPPSPQ